MAGEVPDAPEPVSDGAHAHPESASRGGLQAAAGKERGQGFQECPRPAACAFEAAQDGGHQVGDGSAVPAEYLEHQQVRGVHA